MNCQEFKDFVKDKIVILDGATGSNLIDAGMPKNVCVEEWILNHPTFVSDLLKNYADAGSDIIFTPTIGANSVRLKKFGLESKVADFNTAAVKLAKEAAPGALICGDIAMTGEPLVPYGVIEYEELVDSYREQIICLDRAGCDLIAAETFMDLNEAKAVLEAAKDITALPIMVTMTFEPNGKTYLGTTPQEAAETLAGLGASAVGANCSNGPDQMLPVIKTMADTVDIPIVAKPNAGQPLPSLGRGIKYAIDPGSFAIMMVRLIDAGANLVGGCCGTTPEYIRQMALLCDNMTFKSK